MASHTQTGSIDLTATNAVKLFAEGRYVDKGTGETFATKAELDVAAGEIEARVAATESTLTAVTSGHPNCWRIDRYTRNARVNANSVVPVPSDFLEANFIETLYRAEADMGTNLNVGDLYLGKFTTYVHATANTSITCDFLHDDSAAFYLNDEFIKSATNTTTVSVTFTLVAGWNKLRFLLNEQSGADYARFSTRISTWANVDKQVADLDEYEGTIQESRLTSAETSITQNAEAITLSAQKVSSRGLQLVTNGNGFMGNNANWPTLTFDGSVTNGSPGSFTLAVPDGYGKTPISDEPFPIDPSKEYIFEFDAMSANGTARLYAFLVNLDTDKQNIAAPNVFFFRNTLTTLASDLNPGDTTIKLTSAANWASTSADHQRSIVFWDYQNSYGYLYPEETYSRNYYAAIYADDSKVNKATGVITLKSAWTGPKKLAGTKVSQNHSGNSYNYAIINVLVPNTWTHYSFVYSGMNTDKTGDDVSGKFRQATAFAKVGFLWNYSASTSNPQGQLWVTNISVKENVATQTALDAAKAEIKVTTDGITSTVSKISSAKYVTANATSWTLANLRTYVSEGHQENWNVNSTDGFRVGDVVYVKCTDGTRNVPIYIKTTVKSINSASNFTGISHGMEDILPVDSAISSINQSAESITINANRVNIEGAAIFTGTGRLSSTSLNNAYDAKGAASTVQTNLDNLQVGGRNLIRGTKDWSTVTKSTNGTYAADGTYDGCDVLKVTSTTTNSVDTTFANKFTVGIEADTYYTLSFWAKASAALSIWTFWYNPNQIDSTITSEGTSETRADGGIQTALTTSWKRYWITWHIKAGATTFPANVIVARLQQSASVWLAGCMFEKATKASAWSPAPEDVDAQIDAVQVGSRNIFLNSGRATLSGVANQNNSYTSALTISESIPAGTEVTVSCQIDATNLAWGSSGYKRAGVEFYIDGSSTVQYIGAWAGAALSESFNIVMVLTGTWSGRISKTVTLKYDLPKGRTYGIYVQQLGSGTCVVSKPKLEIGNRATDWDAAPEDTVRRTQRIYYRKTVTGAPAAPSSWVVSSGDGSNAWTQKHISISSTDKYIYTCEQFEMADGTLGHTSILLDDTITVIDGGKILTGTVEANALNATSINASKSLTIGAFQTSTQTDILNSNVQVGGRNLLLGTSDSWSEWVTPTANFNNWTKYWYISKNDELLDWATAGQSVTFSMDIEFSGVTKSSSGTFKIYSQDCFKSVSNVGVDDVNNVDWNTGAAATALNLLTPPADGIYTFTKTVSFSAAHTTRYALVFSIRADYWASGKYRIRRVKYELGNKATDWSPAPEDVTSGINAVSIAVSDVNDSLSDSISGVSESLEQTNGRLTSLTQAVNDADKERAKWIQADDNGLTIGASGSSYKLQLDNNSVDFMVGDQLAATASVDAFIPTALRLGDYVLSGSGGYLYIDYDPLT